MPSFYCTRKDHPGNHGGDIICQILMKLNLEPRPVYNAGSSTSQGFAAPGPPPNQRDAQPPQPEYPIGDIENPNISSDKIDLNEDRRSHLQPAKPLVELRPDPIKPTDPNKPKEPPMWMSVLEDKINEAPTSSMHQQLLIFAQGLNESGYNLEAVAITRYIEQNVPLSQSLIHSQSYLIQAQAFEALEEPHAAKTSLQMATNLANSIKSKKRMDDFFEQVVKPGFVAQTDLFYDNHTKIKPPDAEMI